MIGSILAAGVFVSVPFVGRAAIGGRRPIAGDPGKVALIVAAGLAVWSVPLLATLIVGAYQPAILGAGGWVVVAVQLVRYRGRPRFAMPRLTRWRIVLLLGLAVAGLVYALAPADPVITGRDMAVYALRGVYIATHGRLDIAYPPDLMADGGALPPGWIGFAGIYSTEPAQTVQFGPLLPAWLAQAYAVGGMGALVRLNAIFAVLAALPMFAIARRWTPTRVAVLATFFLAFNAGQIWVARSTLSEMMSQLLVWCGFVLLIAPRPRGRTRVLAWAGVFIGLSAVVRIDSLVMLPLLVVGHAVAAAIDPARHGARAVMPFYAAALPLFAIATVSYATLSAPYFGDLGPQLRLVGVVAVVAGGLFAATLNPPVRRAAASALGSSRVLAPAAGVVLLLAIFAYFVRPALAPFATIDAPGHPLDGSRSHVEDAMRNLGAYVAPPTVWLAVIGWLGASATAVRRNIGWLPVLAVVGGYSGLYFWDQSISPDHFWAIRRFVPIILPATVILAAVTGWLLLRRLPKRIQTAVLALVVVALAAHTWRIDTPMISVPERAGSSAAIEQFSDALPTAPTYLGIFTIDGARSLATPLLLLGNRQVAPLDALSESGRAEILRRISSATVANPVYVVTNLPEDAAALDGVTLSRVHHEYEYMSPTTNPVPSQIGHASFDLLAMEVVGIDTLGTPFGSRPTWLAPDAGFFSPQTVGGDVGRWTDGDASITIPAHGARAQHIDIVILAAAPGGTDLSVLVNGAVVFRGQIPPEGWRGTLDVPGAAAEGDVDVSLQSTTFAAAGTDGGSDVGRRQGILLGSLTLRGDDAGSGGRLVSRAGMGLRLAHRLGQDLVGGLDPGERRGRRVPLAGEALDGGGQGAHAGEAAAADGLAGQDAEAGLDLVHPRRRGRGEVEGDARMALQPALHGRRLVDAHVVEHQVQLAGGVGPRHQAQEGSEVGGGVSRAGGMGHGAGRHLERREQAGGAVAAVVVGMALDLSRSQRQLGLGVVEGLDLGLLVDTQHDGALGRGQVQADDVGDLGHQRRVGAVLEGLDPVGLQARLAPHAADGRGADPDLARQPRAAPVGGARRRRQGGAQDPLAHVAPQASWAAGMRRVSQAGQALFLEPPPPQQHGRDRHSDLVGDVDVGLAGRGAQHDAGALHGALLGGAGAGHGTQRFSFGLSDSQCRSRMSSHAWQQV
jgi:hypothetical protein